MNGVTCDRQHYYNVFVSLLWCLDGAAGGKNTMFEIVFDNEFLGGTPLRCHGNRGYKVPAFSLLNLSYGKRWEEQNAPEQKTRMSQEQKQEQKLYTHDTSTVPSLIKKQSSRDHHEGTGKRTEHDKSYSSKRKEKMVSNDRPMVVMKKQGLPNYY